MPSYTPSAGTRWNLPITSRHLVQYAGLGIWATGMALMPEVGPAMVCSALGGFIVPAAFGAITPGVMAGFVSGLMPLAVYLSHPPTTSNIPVEITKEVTKPPAPASAGN